MNLSEAWPHGAGPVWIYFLPLFFHSGLDGVSPHHMAVRKDRLAGTLAPPVLAGLGRRLFSNGGGGADGFELLPAGV